MMNLHQIFHYGTFDQLERVSQGSEKIIANYNYDWNNNVEKAVFPEIGMESAYEYDAANRITKLNNRLSSKGREGFKGNTNISSFIYDHQSNGLKVEEQEMVIRPSNGHSGQGVPTQKTMYYEYDSRGRLLRESSTDGTDVGYQYDIRGNRINMTIGNISNGYTYNKNNELIRMDEVNQKTRNISTTLYKNDANGNQLGTIHRFPIDNGGKPYFNVNVTLGDNALNDNVVNHYNAFDQLIRSLTRDKKTTYEYDANGLRTKKTVNGVETKYVWDGDQIVFELDGDRNVQKRYVRGVNLIYADGGQGTEKRYYAYNSHGDVVQIIDESGEVIKTYEYDAFGNEVRPDRKDDNPFRYAGEYYDEETETIYLRARYYDPMHGRFISEDPAEDGLNWYVYCLNDPINHIDPSGLKAGTMYKSQNKAAKVWARESYGVTRYIRMERSSLIYSLRRNGYFVGYGYTAVITGDPHVAAGIWDGLEKITAGSTPM